MAIDAALGRLGIKEGVCTSSTRPANPYHGQVVYETDTNRTLVYDNAAWLVVADNQVLSIDSTNGRVGVGTTSPSFPLSVDIDAPATYGNASGNFAQMWTNSGTNALGVSLGDNLGAGLITNNGYDLHLGTSGNSRVTVQSGGNVGINDTTPSYTLDVTGDINATGDLRIGGTAIGEWTTYTPTITNATTTSVDCKYAKVGKFVTVYVRLNIASVTGIIVFTTPSTMVAGPGYGRGQYSDAGSITDYDAVVLQWTTTAMFTRPVVANGTYAITSNNQGTTVPFTWASGDVLQAWFTYQEA